MVIDELRSDLNIAIETYKKRYPITRHIPCQRLTDLENIQSIMQENDPILISRNIKAYLANITGFLSFWPFLDTNIFSNLFREVLSKEKYQENKLLYQLLKEKEQVIVNLQQVSYYASHNSDLHSRINQMVEELRLLKGENAYLYELINEMNTKITQLQKEYQATLQRALHAEEKLETLQKQFNRKGARLSVHPTGYSVAIP